jgi:hypothetical protein
MEVEFKVLTKDKKNPDGFRDSGWEIVNANLDRLKKLIGCKEFETHVIGIGKGSISGPGRNFEIKTADLEYLD